MKRIWGSHAILVVTAYLCAFVLVLIPYYNGLYRVTVNLLHVLLAWASLLIIAVTFFRLCVHKASFVRVFLMLALGIVVLFLNRQVHQWRYLITAAHLREQHCASRPSRDVVLGGITRIKVDGDKETGAFENSSHCMFVVCSEEFYYCSDAARGTQ